MAWTTLKVNGKTNSPLYKEFYCDAVADLASLPTNDDIGKPYSEVDQNEVAATGSIALVAETSDVYILKSDGTWSVL